MTEQNDNTVLASTDLDAIRQKGKDSLFFFARGILKFSDLASHIHKPICDALQNYDENNRVVIVLPRDWFKSSVGSIAYPIWRAINNPNVRILVTQNSMSNARKKLQSIKQMIEKNKLLRVLYPEILPEKSSVWSAECLTVTRDGAYPEGTFEAAGTGTAVTSRHYDLIIEDDTVSPEIDDMTGVTQQPTQMDIEKAIGFHRLTHPLLLHPQKSQIVVIGTRWCERDLLGWIMDNSPDYLLLSRSARENGEIVWDRYNEEVLQELEVNMGPYMFSTLFLNEPLSGINGVFKRDWLSNVYYQTLPAERDTLVFCTSVDPASAKKEGSSDPDYTVVLTTAYDKRTGDVYIVHYTRERMNPGETIDAIFNHYRAYKPVVVKVEAISYQRTLVYWMKKRQDHLRMPFYIEELKSLSVSKDARVKGLQPYFAAGKIHLTTSMGELERELLAFPNGAHDDIVDALSMQIPLWYLSGEERVRAEKQRRSSLNEMTGESILDELMGRARALNRYPYDIGINADKQRTSQLRSYEYTHRG